MIVNSDALTHLMMMDDTSVHCCVTSPPYYGLRDYGVKGQIGLEKTPEEYVARLVEIFRELRRVLRDDGTFWLNIGDSYWGGKGQSAHGNPERHVERLKNGETINHPYQEIGRPGWTAPKDGKHPEIKPKDLIGIPWLLAFALRADGWYLRADLPWIKRNSMPSSVTDRPASSIEHVFLFSKSKKYYYDHVATMQPSSESYNKDKRPRGQLTQRVGKDRKEYGELTQFRKQDGTGNSTYTGFNARYEPNVGGLRYMRDSDFFFRTWQGLMHNEDGEPMALVVNPRGYKGAHFACFPVQLVEPMILAGTSERGVCPVCGVPWVRDVAKTFVPQQDVVDPEKLAKGSNKGLDESNSWNDTPRGTTIVETTGWHPTCSHNLEPVPATVLDPFSGSAATGVACQWHNRNFIGIELKPDYCILAEKRLQENK